MVAQQAGGVSTAEYIDLEKFHGLRLERQQGAAPWASTSGDLQKVSGEIAQAPPFGVRAPLELVQIRPADRDGHALGLSAQQISWTHGSTSPMRL
jgi:hypothetical protein